MRETLSRLPSIIYHWVEPNLQKYWRSKQPLSWLLALFVGLGVGLAAIIFREMIGYVQFFWLGTRSESVSSVLADMPWYLIFLGPVVGGLIVGVCLEKLLPLRRAGGVADVIEAKALGGRSIGFRQAISSAFATVVSLGTGASAGREGPIVHLGAAIAGAVSRHFTIPGWGLKTLLACGVASAVSASFNAPIAGVLFAHEVILGHYAMRAFVPIVISSVSGTLLSRLWFGDAAAFTIPDYQITSLWEFPAFVLLGVVCALVSVLFQFALISSDHMARSVRVPLWTRPVIGGVMLGALGVFLPEILGVGYEVTDQALNNQLPILLMFTLIIAKTFATAITLASRFGGGVFSPALYLGAMTGGTFGLIAAQMFPDMASSQGLYSILGMGAVAAAVLGAPISTTMIMFELTGGYTMTIALLLAVSISNGINHAIHGHSIFQWQLEIRGLFLQDGPHQYMMRMRKVADFMQPVEDGEDIEPLDEDATRLLRYDSLEAALRTFDSASYDRLPVVDEAEPERVIAYASQVHALRYLNSALIEASEEEHQH